MVAHTDPLYPLQRIWHSLLSWPTIRGSCCGIAFRLQRQAPYLNCGLVQVRRVQQYLATIPDEETSSNLDSIDPSKSSKTERRPFILRLTWWHESNIVLFLILSHHNRRERSELQPPFVNNALAADGFDNFHRLFRINVMG